MNNIIRQHNRTVRLNRLKKEIANLMDPITWLMLGMLLGGTGVLGLVTFLEGCK